MDIYNVGYLALDAVSYIAMHFFYLSLYGKKHEAKYLLFTYILSYVCCNFFYFFFPQINNGILLINLIMFTVVCFHYTSNVIRCILGSVFFSIFGIAVELVVSLFLANVFKVDYSIVVSDKLAYLLGSALCKMTLIFITYNMYMILGKRELFKRPGYFCIIAIIFPVCSMFILYFLFINAVNGNLTDFTQVFWVTIFIFLMNIIAFVFYDQICNSQMIREERDQMKHYVELQKNEQEKVDEYNKNMTRIRHDMKNYVLGIASLIENRQYDRALEELNDISHNVLKTPAVLSTQDVIVDHILNAKLWNMNEAKIRLERQIHIEHKIPMSAGELSVLLGNALDNAIEYLVQHKGIEQVISLEIIYRGTIFVVKVENPVEEDILIPKDMIIKTTKKGTGHGIGMKSIKEICTRYNGTFHVTCENKVFTEELRMILNGDCNVKSSGM